MLIAKSKLRDSSEQKLSLSNRSLTTTGKGRRYTEWPLLLLILFIFTYTFHSLGAPNIKSFRRFVRPQLGHITEDFLSFIEKKSIYKKPMRTLFGAIKDTHSSINRASRKCLKPESLECSGALSNLRAALQKFDYALQVTQRQVLDGNGAMDGYLELSKIQKTWLNIQGKIQALNPKPMKLMKEVVNARHGLVEALLLGVAERFREQTKLCLLHFILPINTAPSMRAQMNFIKDNLRELDFTWHNFNSWAYKQGDRVFSSERKLLSVTHRRWTWVIKTMIR